MFFNSTSIVGRVSGAINRAVVSFAQNPRKKGARRRRWWNTKILNNRLYKGSGSGTMMSRLPEGGFKFNAEKERVFIRPEAKEDSHLLKPYVSRDSPVIRSGPVTKWDFLARMEETWGTEAEQKFQQYSRIEGLGKKSGNLGRWGA